VNESIYALLKIQTLNFKIFKLCAICDQSKLIEHIMSDQSYLHCSSCGKFPLYTVKVTDQYDMYLLGHLQRSVESVLYYAVEPTMSTVQTCILYMDK
jgi:hypothetical protein